MNTIDRDTVQLEEEFDTDEVTNTAPESRETSIPRAAGSEFGSGEQLRAFVREAMARAEFRYSELAKEVGYSRTVVSRYMRNEYERDASEIESALRTWLATQPVARKGDEYVETPSAEKIQSVLAYALAVSDMVIIHGGPGVGKTTSIRRFAETYPERVFVVTMTPSASGLVSALETIALAIGVGAATGGARRLSQAIRNHFAACDEPPILIIDEAQHLSIAAIEELRSMHDAIKLGLALVGNEISYQRLHAGPRTYHYAQIYSRFGARLQVLRPTAGDVEAIVDAWHVRDARAIAHLQKLAQLPGGLRAVNKAIRLVTRSGERVTLEALRIATTNLGQEV